MIPPLATTRPAPFSADGPALAGGLDAGAHEDRSSPGWRSYVLACLVIASAAALSAVWREFLGPRHLSLPFIAAVMLSGVWFGLRPALAAAIAAFLAFNFFFVSPHFTLTFTPADFLALITFLATAVLVGGMAGRLSDRARSATQRLGRLATLLAASRDLSAAASPAEAAASLVQRLRDGAGVEAAVWSGGACDRPLAASPGAAEMVASGYAPAETAQCRRIDLVTARGVVGVAAVWFNGRAIGPAERHWIDAILQLGAIALDRTALAAEVSEARLVAEKEGLRTALLSSLSHDLRTPIATILASASSLSANDERFAQAARRELLETIETEAERLNLYVSNLLDMTRLESGALDLKRTPVDPAEAMAGALERMRRRLTGRRIVRDFRSGGRTVPADPILLEQVLVNLLENAASFSPAGSAILASVEADDRCAVLSVTDDGPGVPANELPRVFDKFFRGRTDRARRSGVGLGLSVARGLVEAFEGRISIDSPVREGRGTRLSVHLPICEPAEHRL